MFTKKQNALLNETRKGTPLGEVMRRYWIPALLSEEIPEPDCAPVRVPIMGETLVAFRDTNGEIGLFDEHCAHRGTSLFYGRNEECGLRCGYHGWKYDVAGNVLDTPAEPPSSFLGSHGPLSLVKMTNVFSARPRSRSVARICPVLQSSSSTTSP